MSDRRWRAPARHARRPRRHYKPTASSPSNPLSPLTIHDHRRRSRGRARQPSFLVRCPIGLRFAGHPPRGSNCHALRCTARDDHLSTIIVGRQRLNDRRRCRAAFQRGRLPPTRDGVPRQASRRASLWFAMKVPGVARDAPSTVRVVTAELRSDRGASRSWWKSRCPDRSDRRPGRPA